MKKVGVKMRVITGKGQIVREYILTAPEGTIILPERDLDLEEQSKFIENKLAEDFNGDVITFSAYIISDAPTGSVYNINLEQNKFKLEKNNDHKFGNSADLTATTVIGKHQSCSSLAIKELEKIKQDVKDGIDKRDILNKLAQIGDSFEKMNVVGILIKREKSLDTLIKQKQV